MSNNNNVDLKRRRVLTLATTAIGGVGVGFLAYPFIASWMPSEKAKNAGAPVEVDLSKLKPGELLRVEWQGKPVWILSRTPEMLSRLEQVAAGDLADPESDMNQQPDYAKNAWRSEKKEILVLVGICTHLGCSPTYRPTVVPSEKWLGGFYCPCHGSKFDLAGRVYKNLPAPTNLIVPSHQYLDGNRLLIGQDKENA